MILFFSSNILIIMLSKCKKNIDYFNDESAVVGSSVIVCDNLPKTLYVRKQISLNASHRHSQKILVIYLFFHNKIISQSIFDELLFLITNLEGFIAVSIWLLRFALLFIVFWLIFIGWWRHIANIISKYFFDTLLLNIFTEIDLTHSMYNSQLYLH